MTEYWICSKVWQIWSYIPYSPSDTDKFQWQLTNLNAEFLKLIHKTWMWMTIWRNWTLDLNAVSFSGQNLIENWWNWMQRWRKWAGKPIITMIIRFCILLFQLRSKHCTVYCYHSDGIQNQFCIHSALSQLPGEDSSQSQPFIWLTFGPRANYVKRCGTNCVMSAIQMNILLLLYAEHC